MSSIDVAAWRMHNLRLSGPSLEAPDEVVRWLGAVQAQDYSPAKWAVAQRTVGVSDAAMDRAVANGTILRTHVLRPTWHFVLPADIRWMLELTAPRVRAQSAYHYRQQGLDDTVLGKSGALLAGALKGGNQLTRREVEAVLDRAGMAMNGLRLGLILMDAELSGIVCSGAPRGKQQTYALLDERAPQARRLTRDEALAELTLRYFTGHGPATVKDFRWWSSLTAADVKRGLELVGSHLEHAVIDGLSYWFAPGGPYPRPPSPTVRLLYVLDEYVVGYSESRHVLSASSGATPPFQEGAAFNHVAVLDSQVAGHWKRTLKKGSVIIEATLYAPFDHAQTRALQAEADRHGRFLGLAATVVRVAL